MTVRIITGDCRAVLKGLPDDSVHCCVTSPPYWGLRSYLPEGHPNKPLEIGSEPTLQEWVQTMVEVFREVRRVLRPDGTLWLNLGDAYNSGTSAPSGASQTADVGGWTTRSGTAAGARRVNANGLKVKDMMGQPWRVAFALQADGWWLRQEIIWGKPNPMPESTRDRCTKAHEHVFLLAKGQWKSRVIEFADLSGECLHFGERLALQEPLLGEPGTQLGVRYATAILQRAQRQQNFSLPPFYAEEWKQRADGTDSDFVRCLPIEHRPAVWAARLLSAQASPKEFFGQVNRLPIALADDNEFLVGRGEPLGLDTPTVHGNGDGTITVHDAGKVGKVDFVHEQIVVSTPATCSYFYDFDAMQEPVNGGAHARKPTVKGWVTEGVHTAQAWATNEVQGKQRRVGRRDGPPGNPPESKYGELTGQNGDGMVMPETRNPRSVWTIPTHPFKGAHFATFPPELAARCITAGCPVGGVVLDPFGGSGTVGLVADRQHKDAILIDLDKRNTPMAEDRIRGDASLFANITKETL